VPTQIKIHRRLRFRVGQVEQVPQNIDRHQRIDLHGAPFSAQ